MDISDISSIGRTIDLEYPTNRAIAISTLLVMVGGAIFLRLTGGGWPESFLWGVNVGLAVFLAWALCRELDPDHPMSAFVAAPLALLAVITWGPPELGAILWMIIVMRVVNHTAGPPAGVLDSLGLLGLTGWLSLQGNWEYGVITAAGLFLDGRLPEPVARHLIFALLAVGVTVACRLSGAVPPGQRSLSLTAGLIALALTLLFLPVILASRRIESVGDQTGEPLIPVRVLAAQILALLAGVLTAFLHGFHGVKALSPLWSAVLGASSVCLAYRLIASPRES